jgi:hypothetical protein
VRRRELNRYLVPTPLRQVGEQVGSDGLCQPHQGNGHDDRHAGRAWYHDLRRHHHVCHRRHLLRGQPGGSAPSGQRLFRPKGAMNSFVFF